MQRSNSPITAANPVGLRLIIPLHGTPIPVRMDPFSVRRACPRITLACGGPDGENRNPQPVVPQPHTAHRNEGLNGCADGCL